MERFRRWMALTPDAELQSVGRSIALLGLLTYAFLAYRTSAFFTNDGAGRGDLTIVLLLPAMAGGLAALAGWSRGRPSGRSRGWALVLGGLALLAAIALIAAALVVVFILAMSTGAPA